MSERKRRFFYHYRKVDGKMSVHYKNQCLIVDEVDCRVPCKTKRRNKQPRVVMEGECSVVLLSEGVAIIQ